MWKIWMLICFMAISTTLSGCNMLRGAGEDIEEAGEEIKDAAN